MLKWFARKVNSTNECYSTTFYSNPRSVAKGFFLPLGADDLICRGERQRALQQLWENSPFSRTVFDAFWLSPVRELAIRVQQLPAAQSGTYAREGGFLDEALDTAVCAVRLSRGWLLPPGAAPEDQATQSSVWATAIFYAALLHDIAALGAMETCYENGTPWYAGLVAPTEPWRVRFAHTTGKILPGSSWLAYRLLPEEGLNWLSRWPQILNLLVLYLSDHAGQGGVLHTAVTEARLKLGLPSGGMEIAQQREVVMPPNTDIPQHTEMRETPYGAAGEGVEMISAIPVGIPPGGDYSSQSDKQEMPIAALASAIELKVPKQDKPFVDPVEEASPATILNLLDQFAGVANVSPQNPASLPSETNETRHVSERITTLATEVGGLETAGEAFWNWLVAAISTGELTVNAADSLIHRMSQYIFVQTPECFFRFMTKKNTGSGEKEDIQKSFESLDLHYSRKGKGIYIYRKYERESRTGQYSKVSGYMLPVSLIFTQGVMPPDSTWLSPNK